MPIRHLLLCTTLIALPAPVLAQQTAGGSGPPAGTGGRPASVFDGDYVNVGVGVAYGPSYSGSDDYDASVIPVIRGSLGGVDIEPRAAGLALDVLPDAKNGPKFSFGPAIKLNSDRTDESDIKDPVIAAYGTLDTAVEIGPTFGVSFPGVFNRRDSISISTDMLWDVAGAHKGVTINPGITYFRPINRGVALGLGASATWVDDDYAEYYYSVPPTNTVLPAAQVLPGFDASGGIEKVGVNMLLGIDLNGNAADGGLGLTVISAYSRLLGDAKRTPFTSVRGSADQFFIALGLGYTF